MFELIEIFHNDCIEFRGSFENLEYPELNYQILVNMNQIQNQNLFYTPAWYHNDGSYNDTTVIQ